MRHRRWLDILLICLLTAALGLIPVLKGQIQYPSVHDEFANVLGAETFAMGRLTNPSPPAKLIPYFETTQELLTPTYASKYPPALSGFLAIGILLGNIAFGAVLTHVAAVGAIVWMLQAIMPRRWAIVGGLIAATHTLLYWWGQVYWGGDVAALGGALVAGAALRIARRPRPLDGAILALGAAVLANSRPYEGLLFCIVCFTWLGFQLAKRCRALPHVRRALAPFIIVSLLNLGWMAYYNFRVTGSPLSFPYTLYAQQYQRAPLTYFQNPHEPQREMNPKLADYWFSFDWHEYQQQLGVSGYFGGIARKSREQAELWFAPLTLVVPVAFLPFAIVRSRKTRAMLLLCLAMPLLQMMTTPWMRSHYLAPSIGPFVALLVMGLRYGAAAIPRFRLALPVVLVGVVLAGQVTPLARQIHNLIENQYPEGVFRARQIVGRLESYPGKHLVLVRYEPGPQEMFEWVYNGPDLENARVLFARDLGPRTIPELTEHFRDRDVWILSVADRHVDLHPLDAPR